MSTNSYSWDFSHNHPPFWLIGGSSKKSKISKETPPSGNEFCSIVFKTSPECSDVAIIDISSIIKTVLKTSAGICFSTNEEFYHLTSYTHNISTLT